MILLFGLQEGSNLDHTILYEPEFYSPFENQYQINNSIRFNAIFILFYSVILNGTGTYTTKYTGTLMVQKITEIGIRLGIKYLVSSSQLYL